MFDKIYIYISWNVKERILHYEGHSRKCLVPNKNYSKRRDISAVTFF